MKRKEVAFCPEMFPEELRSFVSRYSLFDSSCSKEARVWMLEGSERFFLKSAAAGTLKTEADMTRYFHSKGLGAEVLNYLSAEQDWLLTRAIPGEDCTFPKYWDDPKRLCDTTATLLRQLHEESTEGCPVTDRCSTYLANARRGYEAGYCELDLFPEQNWSFSSAEEAWKLVAENGNDLKNDTLLHGDYCLPNIMLDNWKFTGFIDVGRGGVGDRHIDIFWGVWTLYFNLKTNAYDNRFLDAYGRDKIQPELLRTVAALETFG
jgi:kanamycin kinase